MTYYWMVLGFCKDMHGDRGEEIPKLPSLQRFFSEALLAGGLAAPSGPPAQLWSNITDQLIFVSRQFIAHRCSGVRKMSKWSLDFEDQKGGSHIKHWSGSLKTHHVRIYSAG